MRLLLLVIITILPSIAALAYDIDSIPVDIRSAREFTGFSYVAGAPYSNPAMQPLRQRFSFSSLSAGYSSRIESKSVVTAAGRGEQKGFFNASTYMHVGKSTVWGFAGYDNGRIIDMRLCESIDAGKISPYTIADTVGGNQKLERYRFGGGYARTGSAISWGASISYVAGLYYRQIDPRPKNITGQLDISAGIAFLAGNYLIGPAFTFSRYRQSTDISFVSEMGESKLFHTTGLGTHYSRFEGSGSNVFSDCYTYSASIDLHPSGSSGAFASVRMSRITLRHVISDLNKLPMANVTEHTAFIQAGYLSRHDRWNWKAYAESDISRRHGKENLFGDPTSGSYPMIGSRLAYADNHWTLRVGGIAEYAAREWSASAETSLGWSHRLAVYSDPHREWLADHADVSLRLTASWRPAVKWMFGVKTDGCIIKSPNSRLYGITTNNLDKASQKFNDAVIYDFRNTTSLFRSAGIGFLLQYAFSTRYALALTPYLRHGSLASGISDNEVTVSLQFIF